MTSSHEEIKKGHTYLQWILALQTNVLSISYGFESGWISPISKLLKSDASPTGSALSSSTLAMIASAMNLSAVFGVLAYAYIADRFGRKASIICISFIQALSWVIKIAYSTSVTLIIARIVGGFAAGGVFVVVPMYVKEISQDNIRGTLGTLVSVTQNSGVFIMYALGGYLPYYTVMYAVVGVPIAMTLLMMLAPESPAFLVKREQIDKSIETVALLRGLRKDDARVLNEVEYMKKTEESFKSLPPISATMIFKDKPWRKGIILISLAFTFQTLNGALAIVTYALSILLSTGVEFNISPQLQTLSFPCIMMLSALTLTVLVDRLGRKWMLVGAFVITTVSMFTLGIAILAQETGYDVPNWLPVLVMILAVAMYGGGISPLPYIIVTELFSFQVRAKIMGGVVSFAWFTSFITVSTYPLIATSFGNYTPFFCYGLLNLIGAIFTTLFLPETKGKSDDEIRQVLMGDKKRDFS